MTQAPSEKQLRALRLRVTPMGYADIGKEMGVVRERAFQLAVRAVRHLLKAENADHPDRPLVEQFKAIRHVRQTYRANRVIPSAADL